MTPESENGPPSRESPAEGRWASGTATLFAEDDRAGVHQAEEPTVRGDVLEAGMWRIENGLIAEGWFFGDELGLLRQVGMYPGD